MTGFLVLPDGSRVPVWNGMVIGRTTPSDVVVQDGKISRRHARLLVSHGVVELEDLGSSNGTMLNGKQISRRVVRDGDRIQVGTSELAYLEAQAETPVARPAPVREQGMPKPAPEVPPPAPVPEVPVPEVPAAGAPASGFEVLEFADEEVVTVRQRTEPAPRAAPASPGAIQARAPGKVLQFRKVEDRRGLFGDDLRQMPPLVRVLIGLIAVGAMIGAAWLAANLVG